MSNQDLKAKLMAQMEAAIDKLLAEKTDASEISLSEIETRAIKAGQAFREGVLGELVAEVDQTDADRVSCTDCGRRMHHKGQRPKQVVTRAGEVKLKRDYYYCPDCGRGIFPPR